MRFATFNVLHGRVLHSRPVPPRTTGEPIEEPLAEAVAALDADVLALQELDRLQDRSGRLDQALLAAGAMDAKDWRYASAMHSRCAPGEDWSIDPDAPKLRLYGPRDPTDGGDIPSHGIALLTRLPVRVWGARWLAPAPVGMALHEVGRPGLRMVRDHPRTVLAAVLDGDHGPFTVVAVHLSFVPGWNAGQLLAIHRWIAHLPRPHVMLGDFNMIGAVPRIVLNAAEALSRRPLPPGGWRDLARLRTFPSHRPLVQFDHVLANGIPREAVRAASTPPMPISDHRPLVVDAPVRASRGV